jgi:hypothetical protein
VVVLWGVRNPGYWNTEISRVLRAGECDVELSRFAEGYWEVDDGCFECYTLCSVYGSSCDGFASELFLRR